MRLTKRGADPASDLVADDEAVVQLRREDLAALTQAYLREARAPRQWLMLGAGIGGLAMGVLLITLGEWLHWPESLQPVFFFGGWAIMLGMTFLSVRRDRELRQRYQFRCPHCDAALLNGIRDSAGLARVEVVIATGVCPACGTQVLEP